MPQSAALPSTPSPLGLPLSDGPMAELARLIEAHPFLSHPCIARIRDATPLTLPQARRFALAYYPHILQTRLYQAHALGNAADEAVQFAFAQILFDEYGNGDASDSHMEIYRRFMRAVGCSEAEIADGGRLIPEVQDYIDAMTQLARNGDWLAAAAAFGIASEWPIPPYYQALLTGLSTLGLSAGALELFSGHIGLDEEHSRMMIETLTPHATDPAGLARMRAGIKANLDARVHMLDGLQREVFKD